MLTDEQKKLVEKGLAQGLTDPVIAQMIGAKHIDVYKYRHSLGITRFEVLDNRYDQWLRLLKDGQTLDYVGELYDVKPDTILSTLYRKRDFSYVEVKKEAGKALEAKYRKAMGVTAKDVREQRNEAWVRLFNNGMEVEEIATMYEVAATTVRNALSKHADAKPARGRKGVFDW